MTVSQAFIFHFKCYSILHFAVCQLLRWPFVYCLLENLRYLLIKVFNFCLTVIYLKPYYIYLYIYIYIYIYVYIYVCVYV